MSPMHACKTPQGLEALKYVVACRIPQWKDSLGLSMITSKSLSLISLMATTSLFAGWSEDEHSDKIEFDGVVSLAEGREY